VNVAELAARPDPTGDRGVSVAPIGRVPEAAGPIAPRTVRPAEGAPAVPSPSPSVNFEGMPDVGQVDGPRVNVFNIPPDTMGAVGDNHLMVQTNSNFRIQDRNGTTVSTTSIESFWGGTGATGVFDPHVLYDPYNDRWIATATANSRSAASAVLIGLSRTSDPTGTWDLFRIDADAGDTLWADYPTIGLNKNWIAIALNMFTNANDTFSGARLLVVNYPDYRANRVVTDNTYFTGINAATMQPAVTYSTTEETLYLPEQVNSAGGTFALNTITGTATNPVFNLDPGPFTALPLGGWTSPSANGDRLPQRCDAACPATLRGIDPGDSRILNAVFRNGHIWWAQTVGLPAGGTVGRTAAQWVRIAPNKTFVDGGRVEDPTATATNGGRWYAYPTIAVNTNGDALLGFSEFESDDFADAAYAFRAAGDLPGTMQDPLVFKEGEDYYDKIFSATRNRWGDYSATQVDPANDADFWTLQEYADTRSPAGCMNPTQVCSRWGTWWAKVALAAGPASADLAVSIFDNPDPAGLGQPLDYDVGIVNQGPDAATSVTLTDTLPAGVTFVSATPSQGTCSQASGVVTCSLGDIAAGISASVQIQVTTPTSPATLTNTASVTATTSDPNAANNSVSETTSVESGVDLALSKSDLQDPVHPGSNLTYTVLVNNNGPNPATGVQVTDTLPSGVTFVSATPSQGTCSQASGTVTCQVGALAVNASASIQIVVTTPSTASTLTNSASVTGNETDPDTTNNSATQETTVAVSGAVISNGTVSLGVNDTGDLNYDCRAAGDPTCPAASPGGVDPVGLRFNALNTDGTAPGCLCEGWGMADAVSGLTGYDNEAVGQANITVNSFVVDGTTRAVSDVTISNPSIAGHQMRVVQDYHPSAASPNMYENTVTVTNTGANPLGDVRYRRVMDWDVEPTAFSEWSTIQGSSPQLLFDSDDGFASADPLSARTYINSQVKCGVGYTGACAFKDLGTGGEYPAVTTPDDLGALFDFGFGSLPAGQSKTFRVFYGAAADEAAALSAIGSVGAEVYSIGEPSCPRPGATTGGCATLPANAGVEQGKPNTFIFAFVTTAGDLSITKSDAPDPVRVNQDLTYTLTVRNNGPDPVTAVQVSDTLPAGVTHVSTTTTRGTCSGTTTVSCNLGTMPNGATDTITIVVRPTAPGTLSNTATVSSPSHDVNLGNNTSTASTTVNPAADLALTKTDAPDPVLAGNELTYTLTVTNNGPNDAAGVTITDPLPAGVNFVLASAGCAYDSGTRTVTCTIGALLNGANAVRTIVVTPTAANPSLTNTATASATTADPDTGNNSATATTVVNPAADLALTKTDTPDPVLAGNELTYTLTVTNNGPSDAAGVTITDTLPAGVGFVSASLGCTHDSGTRTVTCPVGALANGASATRTIVVRPSTPGSLSNTASVSSTTADPNSTNNSATEETTVSPVPTVSISDVSQLEGNSGTSAFVFTVTKSATGHPASVDFATANGTASSVSDYTAANGTLSFGASDATKTITVLAGGDTTFEADETFLVNLSNASGATIADNQGVGTILNDDTAPSLAIDNVSKAEGNAGTTAFTFTVTKIGPTELPASVDYATANGTAIAPGDYATGNGTLNFAAGDTSKPVTVLVNGDTTFEPNETFVVNLSNASGATITDNQGQGTIENDDGAATLAINDVSMAEGNAGTTAFTFTVTKSNTDEAATVDFATANDTATAPGDYAAVNGTLNFAAGDATKTITVAVNGDTAFELNETFLVNLSNAVGATLADNQGQGTIQNDDSAPTLAIDNVSMNEGNTGTTAFVFTVTKSGATELPASVDFATADGTATAPGDYAAGNGTLNFAAGDTSKPVTVLVNGDTTFEANETFAVNLSNAIAATIADNQGQGTIVNDDAAPTFAIDNVGTAEGNAGTTAFTFTVTKIGPTELPASVDFATADGSATAPSEYAAQSGTRSFAPSETTKTITVLVNGDTVFEANETFTVNLSNASGATIADSEGVGTIVNDDGAPTLAIDNVSKVEGNAGTTAFTFTVTKAGATELLTSVDFATADGTAGASEDYAEQHGTLSFAPGETTKSVTVLVNGDSAPEPDETFVVNLSNPANATIADNQGLGTIQDDDAPPTLSIGDVSKTEGNAGTTAFTFTVTKSRTGIAANVDFASANGTATQPGDYAAHSGTLNFAPGEATKTITVDVNGDTTFEANETFFVNLSNASGATIADNQGQGTIENDDAAPSLTIDNVSMVEGNSGTTAFLFTVTKTGATELPAGVDFSTANGTATQFGDYQAQSGTLSFSASETTKQVTIVVNGDTTFEADETFTVNLSLATNATIADNAGAGTIGNDDAAPSFAIDNVTRAEGNSGTTAFTFTVTKSGATDLQAGVNFATANGTATAPADYAAQSGALSFAATETSKAVTVLVNGETTVELDETFLVNLTNASGATIADNQGQGTIQNDDTTTRPPLGARCVVPNVKGKTVAMARRLLASKRCALGRVTYAYSRKVKKGRIISQSKRPGTRHPRGTKVNVVVSRGKRKSSRRGDD
jgi:uncharacterized repeat protein (TIGR01451 family)